MYAPPINPICKICGFHRSSKQHKARAGACAKAWRQQQKERI